MLNHALAGITVLDFSQGIAGPHGACLLGEMGAEVIKIEPPAGDWLRGLGHRQGGTSVLFGYFNRGKAGVALDLKDPAQRRQALALIDKADVLIESNRPGVMARLGLGYEQARQRNPAWCTSRSPVSARTARTATCPPPTPPCRPTAGSRSARATCAIRCACASRWSTS